MRIKKVLKVDADFFKKKATEVKIISDQAILRHTRKCNELNQATNCKITVEKKSTKQDQELYDQFLKEERLKNEPDSK